MKLFVLWFILANDEVRYTPADIVLCNQMGEQFAISAAKKEPVTIDGIPVTDGGCVVHLYVSETPCDETS